MNTTLKVTGSPATGVLVTAYESGQDAGSAKISNNLQPTPHIEHVQVKTSHQRQGIGLKLLTCAIAQYPEGQAFSCAIATCRGRALVDSYKDRHPGIVLKEI